MESKRQRKQEPVTRLHQWVASGEWAKMYEEYQREKGLAVTHYKGKPIERLPYSVVGETGEKAESPGYAALCSKEGGYAWFFYAEMDDEITMRNTQIRLDRLLHPDAEHPFHASFPEDFATVARVPADVVEYLKYKLQTESRYGHLDYAYLVAGDLNGPRGIAIAWDKEKDKLVRLEGTERISELKEARWTLEQPLDVVTIDESANVKDCYNIYNIYSCAAGIAVEDGTTITQEELERRFWINMFNRFVYCAWWHHRYIKL